MILDKMEDHLKYEKYLFLFVSAPCIFYLLFYQNFINIFSTSNFNFS